MDLNELLGAHQLELMKASASCDASTREGHFTRVAFYANRIQKLRDSYHMRSPIMRPVLQETLICELYAGDSASDRQTDTLECWKSEGEALYSPRPRFHPASRAARSPSASSGSPAIIAADAAASDADDAWR